MFSKLFRHLPLPRSLRWQFILALVAWELLMVMGGVVAVHDLQVSAEATRQLSEERLGRLQDAQDLVEHTLLIERHTEKMLAANSLEKMRAANEEISLELQHLDRLVENLGTSSADLSVLALQSSGQLFRNTANVVAGLKGEILQRGEHDSQASQTELLEKLQHFHEELQGQAVEMVRSAQQLSNQVTGEYRATVKQLAATSSQNKKWVLALFLTSLVLAWLVYQYFLSQQVLLRLQQVSNYLRLSDNPIEHSKVPVEGGDEIAEMARAVEQFLEDRKRLAEANAELESFSYSVSHDLQAPLRAIIGFSQLLVKNSQAQLNKDAQQYLEFIIRSASRMRDLINDILQFSRMSRRAIETGTIDLETMAQEVFQEVREPVPERDITLVLGKLPPAQGDRSLLRQVLVNLLANAVKFTAQEAKALIEVTCTEEGELNTYCVKDNGIGFEMKYAGELFGVFKRIYGAEQFEGTGIGLAIVKRIIVRHGGSIWADSKPGQGASFFFTLPRGEAEKLKC